MISNVSGICSDDVDIVKYGRSLKKCLYSRRMGKKEDTVRISR